MSSLLAYLAPRLTGRTEDIAVEALGYILSNSIAARSGLFELLRAGGAEIPEVVAVKTQASKDRTRPDLVGFDDQGRERVLVEAKFWAGLTDNQPKAYLDRLTDNGGATALLFVAPKARLETLWAELCRLTGCEPGPAAEDPRSAAIAGDKSLILSSWPALLTSLSAQAALQGDRVVEADISQLRALCERQDEAAFLPLRPDEFAPAFPRRLLQLNRLIDDATELAVKLWDRQHGGIIKNASSVGLRALPSSRSC